MADRKLVILGYEPPRRRPWRRIWLPVQILLTIVVLFAVIRALRSQPPSISFNVTPTKLPLSTQVVGDASQGASPRVQDPFSSTTNDVTKGLFLLLRTQDITSEVFSCPTTQPTKWDFDQPDLKLHWSTTRDN